MKKFTLLLFFFLIVETLVSQVVFCPPGAEWHYSFKDRFSAIVENENIKYIRDTVISAETYKVLRHTRQYVSNNLSVGNPSLLTLIKQSGDTIFLRNYATRHKWQVLYNFAALQGQSWKDTIGDNDPATNITSAFTYTVRVDSVRNVTINNFLLKRLHVIYFVAIPDLLGFKTIYTDTTYITERIGCERFMFNYEPVVPSGSDENLSIADQILCYKDNSFGLVQFTGYPCEYSNPVSFEERDIDKNDDSGIFVFPNPSNDKIYFDIPFQNVIEITVFSTLGPQVLKIKDYQNLSALDVSMLDKGIYFYHVRSKTKNYSGKFVKE